MTTFTTVAYAWEYDSSKNVTSPRVTNTKIVAADGYKLQYVFGTSSSGEDQRFGINNSIVQIRDESSQRPTYEVKVDGQNLTSDWVVAAIELKQKDGTSFYALDFFKAAKDGNNAVEILVPIGGQVPSYLADGNLTLQDLQKLQENSLPVERLDNSTFGPSKGISPADFISTTTTENDTINASGQPYPYNGGVGNDTINGSSGIDFVIGGDGNDKLYGGGDADFLLGGAGNDLINPGDSTSLDYVRPGAGNDQVILSGISKGEVDIDHADLQGAGITADINLATNTAVVNKGSNGTTTITDIVNPATKTGLYLYGTKQDDVFNLTSVKGSQVLLLGGAGNDAFNLSGDGGDVRLSYSDSTERGGIIANLTTGSIKAKSTEEVDTVKGVEHVTSLRASDGNDNVYGSERSETLLGRNGDDLLSGEASANGAYDAVSASVVRLYQATLGRLPDAVGHAGWVKILNDGKQLLEVIPGFTGSAEFKAKYGSTSDSDFVSLLYKNVLGRDGAPAEVKAWTDLIDAGSSRAKVVFGFAESQENIKKMEGVSLAYSANANDSSYSDDVFRLYQATLGRSPDMKSFKIWSNLLGSGEKTYDEVIPGFTGSAEFKAKYGNLSDAQFVNLLYTNVLGREGRASEVRGWLDEIKNGSDRTDVVRGFAQSVENINKSAASFGEWLRKNGESDTLSGDSGTNKMFGGMGSDVFVFNAIANAESGKTQLKADDTVVDLEPWDVVQFNGFGYSSDNDVRAHLTQVGTDVVFEDGNTKATFLETTLATFTDDMITFS